MKNRIVCSVGLFALSVFPTFGQEAQRPATTALAAESRPADAALSSNVSQVLKLAQSGVSDDVILAYVKNSYSFYNLSADDVLRLKDAGLSSLVLSAMLAHDNALRSQQEAQKRTEVALTPPPAPAPAPATTPAPAPTVTVVTQAAPPPQRIEYIPVAPGPDYYWDDGYWSWRGNSWVWIGGSWSFRPGFRVWIGGGPHWGGHWGGHEHWHHR